MQKLVDTVIRFTDDLYLEGKIDYKKYVKPFRGKYLKEAMSLLNIVNALHHASTSAHHSDVKILQEKRTSKN